MSSSLFNKSPIIDIWVDSSNNDVMKREQVEFLGQRLTVYIILVDITKFPSFISPSAVYMTYFPFSLAENKLANFWPSASCKGGGW